MSLSLGLSTLFGAALLPLLIHLLWGRLVEQHGVLGGYLAAGLIVGSMWVLNHGLGMIAQSGEAWVDMALAAGMGALVISKVKGGRIRTALPNLGAALLGALISGALLALFL